MSIIHAPQEHQAAQAHTKSKKRKAGPVRLSGELKRSLCVSTRVNAAELEWLDSVRGSIPRGEYLRRASMGVLPPTIPAVNREAWVDLGRLLSNLNQYQSAINAGISTDYPAGTLEKLLQEVRQLRQALVDTNKAARNTLNKNNNRGGDHEI